MFGLAPPRTGLAVIKSGRRSRSTAAATVTCSFEHGRHPRLPSAGRGSVRRPVMRGSTGWASRFAPRRPEARVPEEDQLLQQPRHGVPVHRDKVGRSSSGSVWISWCRTTMRGLVLRLAALVVPSKVPRGCARSSSTAPAAHHELAAPDDDDEVAEGGSQNRDRTWRSDSARAAESTSGSTKLSKNPGQDSAGIQQDPMLTRCNLVQEFRTTEEVELRLGAVGKEFNERHCSTRSLRGTAADRCF